MWSLKTKIYLRPFYCRDASSDVLSYSCGWMVVVCAVALLVNEVLERGANQIILTSVSSTKTEMEDQRESSETLLGVMLTVTNLGMIGLVAYLFRMDGKATIQPEVVSKNGISYARKSSVGVKVSRRSTAGSQELRRVSVNTFGFQNTDDIDFAEPGTGDDGSSSESERSEDEPEITTKRKKGRVEDDTLGSPVMPFTELGKPGWTQ